MRVIDKIIYSQDGVHQCWTCKNMVGRGEFKVNIHDADSTTRQIICVLSECKVADKYMTSVYETPCSKYSCWIERSEK